MTSDQQQDRDNDERDRDADERGAEIADMIGQRGVCGGLETDDGESTGLSQIELDMFFVLLIIAGSETTRNAVSLGLLALLDHPAQLEHLRRVPGAIPLAVEEILRWSSPVSCFARRATRDTQIRGR